MSTTHDPALADDHVGTADAWTERGIGVASSSGGHRAPSGLLPMPSGGVRLELDAVMRSKDAQYDVSTSHRRQALGELFTSSSGSDHLDGRFTRRARGAVTSSGG